MNKKASYSRIYKFNFVDVFLILIILLAAGAIAYFLLPRGNGKDDAEKTVAISYQLTVSSISQTYKGNIKEGDNVYDNLTGQIIGKVTNVTYAKKIYFGSNRNEGGLTYSDYPGFLTMTVTVAADADISNDEYNVSGSILKVGATMDFRVPSLSVKGCCTAIDTVTES